MRPSEMLQSNPFLPVAASVLFMRMCVSEGGQPTGKGGPRLLDNVHLPGDAILSFCIEQALAVEVIPKNKGKLTVVEGDSASKCS